MTCPQRGDSARPSLAAGRRSRHLARNKYRRPLGIALLSAVVCVTAGCTTSAMATQPPTAATPARAAADNAGRESVNGLPPFCERDLSREERRKEDIPKLEAMGGLVYLLKRPESQPPFKCAAHYLAYGLKVDAKSDKTGLTALHYAIKANRPKLVEFLVKWGAALHIKAGAQHLEPMSYAYYLALSEPHVNRNRIIVLLNYALIQERKYEKQEIREERQDSFYGRPTP